MPKRILVIERDDQNQFFLSVDRETVLVGDSPTQGSVVLRDLHISRIHCEFEVEDETVVVSQFESGESPPTGPQELHDGGTLHIGKSLLRLEAVNGGATDPAADMVNPPLEPAIEEPVLPELDDLAPAEGPAGSVSEAGSGSAKPVAPGQIRRLMVIDGADQGRFASVPTTGSLSIGNSHKHADFVLHDLYVSRVHCELLIEGDKVFVNHIEGAEGTLINKQRIKGRQEMRLGDVLRVGNSHLRLEMAEADEKSGEGDSPLKMADEDAFEVIEETAEEDKAAKVAESLDHLVQLENQVFGHYKIGPLMGRGHTGLVFSAQDLKNKQVVALKVLAPAFPANDAELQRFVKTLKATIPLHHPNLIAIYTGGKTGRHCWTARELIEGESLARRIERLKDKGPWDWKRAARVAIHLTQALAFLEERQVCHGNVTPSNILIRKSDKVTKLTDLGLTTSLAGSQLQQAIAQKKWTEELPFLAPERLDPDAIEESIPADLYSVGAVVYTLLTGQLPFSGKSPDVIRARIQNAHVVKPTKVQRDIPAVFEAVVMKLLAKNPADRYPTAADTVDALDPVVRLMAAD